MFSGHTLLKYLNKMRYIFKTKKDLKITLEGDNIYCES